MSVRLTVLGCGSSSGCPVVGCACATCTSDNPKNQRLRSSAWIEADGVDFIIDTGPDFRAQALRARIPKVDAVLYTHPHADHMNGIDDLRAYCFLQRQALQVYGHELSLSHIQERFSYTLLPPSSHWNRPVLNLNLLEGCLKTPDVITGVAVHHAILPHGGWTSAAYRIGDIAWITDVNALTDEVIDAWQNLSHVFLDCLNRQPYPSHLSWSQAIGYLERLKARQGWLIHMTHSMEYDEVSAMCPPGVAVAYDGLTVFAD